MSLLLSTFENIFSSFVSGSIIIVIGLAVVAGIIIYKKIIY